MGSGELTTYKSDEDDFGQHMVARLCRPFVIGFGRHHSARVVNGSVSDGSGLSSRPPLVFGFRPCWQGERQ